MTVRWAIITDIHGNSPALKAVLAELEALGNIQHIYCLGDMIGNGPDTNEVLELLFSRKDVSMIQGNHERSVFQLIEGRPTDHTSFDKRQHHEWIAERLNVDYYRKLKELPLWLEVEYERCRFLFIHYHMNAEQGYLPIDSAPTAEKLDGLYQGTQHDLVCFGHSHRTKHIIQSKKRIYMNPGSLGCSHTSTARYGLLQINNGAIQADMMEAPYDNRSFIESFAKLGVTGWERILPGCYGIPVTG